MNLPTLPQILTTYIHASDESRSDMSTVIGAITETYLSRWAWHRTARKVGPILLKIRNGEKISTEEARLLLTTLTLSVYLASRNAYAGWKAAQQLSARMEALNQRLQDKLNPTNTTKEQTS